MSHILITGGSGSLGRQLIPLLMEAGHTVRVLSRRARKASDDVSLEWAQGALASGEGVAEAVEGVDTIIHAASTPAAAKKVDIGGAQRLLEIGKKNGLAHFVYISIVGVDQHPFPYYKAKYETERLIRAQDVPWTILRATQFHTFLGDLIIPALFRMPLVFLPTDIPFQLIDVSEVGQRMTELVQQGPSEYAEDIGGPEILSWGELANSWMAAQGMQRKVRHLPIPGKVARAFREGVHTTPENRYGKISWQQWLDKRFASQAKLQTESAQV
ncbi:MAG: NAD-dependent epimerase/dehydratase family protein [Chloroflexi bacterium]|nr:MAG: NAD-dependent epimerase/dehydratase family protein [Chloroflexota bacterium]MBL1196605.1 NAD-dependent epimerase/dehydratase family protein [Chloroflexota bacterium]NOH13900.1 NAD(P)H-binding protein [Chloroflexota bacterium]